MWTAVVEYVGDGDGVVQPVRVAYLDDGTVVHRDEFDWPVGRSYRRFVEEIVDRGKQARKDSKRAARDTTRVQIDPLELRGAEGIATAEAFGVGRAT